MKTTLFEWADARGLSMEALSKMLGYSARQLYRIKAGEYAVTETFMARVVFKLGSEASSLFLPQVSDANDNASEVANTCASAVSA